jgi:hypothetical protein
VLECSTTKVEVRIEGLWTTEEGSDITIKPDTFVVDELNRYCLIVHAAKDEDMVFELQPIEDGPCAVHFRVSGPQEGLTNGPRYSTWKHRRAEA